MSDLIDRQDAIDAIENDASHIAVTSQPMWEKGIITGMRAAEIVIKKLPSARKKGKWINNKCGLPACNQCGYMTPYDRAIDDYEYGNYCPHCGADMRGEG